VKAVKRPAAPINIALRKPRWRDYPNLKIHPVCDALPLMSPEKLRALGEGIKKSGLYEKVKIRDTPDGFELLDGRNRLDAMQLTSGGGSYEFDPLYFEKVEIADDKCWDDITSYNNPSQHPSVYVIQENRFC